MRQDRSEQGTSEQDTSEQDASEQDASEQDASERDASEQDMSQIERPLQSPASGRTRMLRAAIHACIAVQVLIYLYLFVYIGEHANPKGDGMEWVAIVPGGAALAVGALPAWVLRERERWLPVALITACVGILLNLAYLYEIARESAESAAP
jgi:Flp pilus assembly protein TadB